jgi:hypothetical protein
MARWEPTARLGRHPFRPVIDPLMSSPGDGDYPEPEYLAVAIGTVTIDGASACDHHDTASFSATGSTP